MIRRVCIAATLACAPAAAWAEGGMPQMDFHNPLTSAQLIWMVVILLALYLALSRWGLPRLGAVLENRAALIARDLAAARAAKTEADQAVNDMDARMRAARARAQAEIAESVARAKAEAAAAAQAASRRLDAQLEAAEAQIATAREAAMQAIKPVAEQAAAAILARMTGYPPNAAMLSRRIELALAARDAA
jgi:F-type H+-transporting ATPase subunit b